MIHTEKQISDRLIKREKQLKELAKMVIDEMTDPSPELAKKLINYSKGEFYRE
jgi:hypothetical protein